MTELAKQWGGFGIIVVALVAAVALLFRLLIANHVAEREQWFAERKSEREQRLAERQALQDRLDRAYHQNDQLNETFNQQIRDLLGERIKEQREFFREQVTLSNTVISSTLGAKDAMTDVKDQMKALQEDYQDQNGFVKGLLERLAKDKAEKS